MQPHAVRREGPSSAKATVLRRSKGTCPVRKSTLIALLLSAFTSIAIAQSPKAASRPPQKTAPAALPQAASQLPVTRVSLYKNGVGFFEHAGRVSGDQAVTIDFTTAQLNDVLQSLTAIDLNGGRISGAGYNSTTPLDQQLKSLPLALGEDASAVDFYNAIRGARISVTGSGAAIIGRLLNIEVTDVPAANNQPATQKRLLTVIGDDGSVRSVDLTSNTTVRLLDSQLHSDVSRYLELLASTRNDGLRHLTLQDNGAGSRELHVSYLSEVPIWKSTYRILFTEPKAGAASAPQQATLQGWSVVDNTTGADWINVHLSLIAGAPQSFIQPLSVPYYSRRPEISLPQEAQLTPQTHESGELNPNAAPVMATGSAGGVMGGLGNGAGGNYGGSVRRVGNADPTIDVAVAPEMNASAGSIALSGRSLNSLISIDGTNYAQLAQASIAPNSSTAAFDDYFAYNLTDPITIRKNESALVPILQTSLPAESVSLVSYANARVSQPLRALWLTNSSDLTLDRGSFTIVEDGEFGGEGLLDPIHPGEKRLLSYAADQALHVSTEGEKLTSHVVSVTAAKGVLRFNQTDVHEVTLVMHNAAPARRTVVSEFPVVDGWQLDSDPAPTETTATVYRFRTLVDPGQTVRLHVGARRVGQTAYQLTNFNNNQLTVILNQAGSNADAVKLALQPIFDARAKVAEMQAALDKANARLDSLRSDEERQRANITALAGADKASRDRFVHDLNATEDQIAAAQKDLATAQANLQSANDDLANRIATVQLDQQL
jgi:hypothetical protein